MTSGRGPGIPARCSRGSTVPDRGEATIDVRLERWIDPQGLRLLRRRPPYPCRRLRALHRPDAGRRARGHVPPGQGRGPERRLHPDLGACATTISAGSSSRTPTGLSDPRTVIKYDVEVSGFGSQALGHVCLLNLRDQTYPGLERTATKGWPTWTTPVLRWAKAQGAVTGYAHSASGLEIDPARPPPHGCSRQLDRDKDGVAHAQPRPPGLLLPADFATIDADRDGVLTRRSSRRPTNAPPRRLPNVAIPEMNGVGAHGDLVTVPRGALRLHQRRWTPPGSPSGTAGTTCSNCGFPLKVSGETDFPCMSGTAGRPGTGLRAARQRSMRSTSAPGARASPPGGPYVSDGYAHALEFTVDGKRRRVDRLELRSARHGDGPGEGRFRRADPAGGRPRRGRPAGRAAGSSATRSTCTDRGATRVHRRGHEPPGRAGRQRPRSRAARCRPTTRSTSWTSPCPIERSSWVALRQFPQMHTNPVDVLVAGRPIRASRRSALWCLAALEQLWKARGGQIAAGEREDARRAFDQAIPIYRKIAAEAPEGG